MEYEYKDTVMTAMFESMGLYESMKDLKRLRDSGKITSDEFTTIRSLDVSSNGKYVQAIAKWYITSGKTLELNDVISLACTKFESVGSRLSQSDVNQYTSFDEFSDAVSSIGDSTTKVKKERNKDRRDNLLNSVVEGEDYNTILNKEGIKIYQPLTTEGSIALGDSTDWCTAYKSGPNQFTAYSANKSRFAYIFVDGDKKSPYAIRSTPQPSNDGSDVQEGVVSEVQQRIQADGDYVYNDVVRAVEHTGIKLDDYVKFSNLFDVSSQPHCLLFRAITSENEDEVRRLVGDGVDLNGSNGYNMGIAIRFPKMLKLCIELGGDVDTPSVAHYMALALDMEESLDLLVGKMSIETFSPDGKTIVASRFVSARVIGLSCQGLTVVDSKLDPPGHIFNGMTLDPTNEIKKDVDLIRRAIDIPNDKQRSEFLRNPDSKNLISVYNSITPLFTTNIHKWFDIKNLPPVVADGIRAYIARGEIDTAKGAQMMTALQKSEWYNTTYNKSDVNMSYTYAPGAGSSFDDLIAYTKKMGRDVKVEREVIGDILKKMSKGKVRYAYGCGGYVNLIGEYPDVVTDVILRDAEHNTNYLMMVVKLSGVRLPKRVELVLVASIDGREPTEYDYSVAKYLDDVEYSERDKDMEDIIIKLGAKCPRTCEVYYDACIGPGRWIEVEHGLSSSKLFNTWYKSALSVDEFEEYRKSVS